jgi:hypothetical protein
MHAGDGAAEDRGGEQLRRRGERDALGASTNLTNSAATASTNATTIESAKSSGS